MNKIVNGKTVSLHFNSITDVCNYIEHSEPTDTAKELQAQGKLAPTVKGKYSFYNTDSLEEAISLFKGGWEAKAREIKGKIEKPVTGANKGHRNVYDVVGYQASVPRYLQGIPTNMVRSVQIPKKDKVINIYKNICYNWEVPADEILKQSVKVLNLVQRLEQDGYRVNLYTVAQGYSHRTRKTWQFSVPIKQSSQRLNIKQMAFPLIHPSMLRRIITMCLSIPKELESRRFYSGYGTPEDVDVSALPNVNKQNCYYIPASVSEEQITDINRYKVAQ